MRIKLKDIAREAGVSEATASLALNGSKLVKEATGKRIREIAKELGYSPNAIAQGLAKKRSGTVGLVVPDIESAYYSKLVRCIDEAVRERGYSLVLEISNDKAETEKRIIKNFISQRVEGVIIAPVNQPNNNPGYFNILEKNEIPYVFTTARYMEVEAPYVMVDLEEGMYRLVKYLLDLGHRRIVFFAGSNAVLTTVYRINGYKRAFEERGLTAEPDCFIECKHLDYAFAYEIAEKLVKSIKDYDAVVTMNDMMALGVVNALRKSGFRIPEDISAAGYDDTIFSGISPVPITTVR